jgi:hypothetical protein
MRIARLITTVVVRRWIGGLLAGVLVAALCVLVTQPAQALPPTCSVASDRVFGVQANGNLWDYEYGAPGTGDYDWQSASMVGTGFVGRVLTAGGFGDTFLITPSGDMRIYMYDGSGQWSPFSGGTIGNGFQRYVTNPNLITMADRGDFFAVDASGNLRHYQWNQTGGLPSTGYWNNGLGDVIGTGWGKYRVITSTSDAVWAVDYQGNVFRYPYQSGSNWTGQQVASGWNNYTALTSAGGGVVYAVDGTTGNLYWYHYDSFSNTFDNYGHPRLIGVGFTSSTFAQLSADDEACFGWAQETGGAVGCSPTATVLDARPNGDLWEYNQTSPDQRGFTWNSSAQIGGGFGPRIIGGPDGAIYLITSSGDLRLYVHDDEPGWLNGGTTIGHGFQRWAANPNLITSDGFGHIFVVDATGALRSFRYDASTGTWDNGVGTVLDTGWDKYRLIFATDDNQIYGIDSQNNVDWYSYDDATQQWAQHAKPIASGWQYSSVFSPGGGLFYAIDGSSGNMYSLQFNESLGAWSTPTAALVGNGWTASAHSDVTAVTNGCAAPVALPVSSTAATGTSCPGNISIFDARTNGDLWLYQHTPPTTAADSYTAIPRQIGSGFTGHTLAGGQGDLFNITPTGDLRLYHFDGTQLANNGAYQTIGTGWGAYVSGTSRGQITVDPDNDIWAIDATGVLKMFHYNETTQTWDNPSGTVIAQQMGKFSQLVATAPGVFYAYGTDGNGYPQVVRFQYDSATQQLTESYPQGVAPGGGPMFSAGGGIVYQVAAGVLSWYHEEPTPPSTTVWSSNRVDVGWVADQHQDLVASMDGCSAPA